MQKVTDLFFWCCNVNLLGTFASEKREKIAMVSVSIRSPLYWKKRQRLQVEVKLVTMWRGRQTKEDKNEAVYERLKKREEM